MRWSAQQACHCEQWYQSPTGAYALARERELLSHLTEPWPRRHQKLLEIGCGTGVFLESFWRAGFDVSGLDSSPCMLDAARERLGKHADLHLGRAEHLPFADNEFDFAAIITTLEFVEDRQAAVREAVRVARKGVLIAFLNRYSCYYLARGRCWRMCVDHAAHSPAPGSLLQQAHWLSLGEVKRLVHQATGPKEHRARGVLPLPERLWRDTFPWKQLGRLFYPPPLGAFCAVRFDLVGDPVRTPLLAWKSEINPG